MRLSLLILAACSERGAVAVAVDTECPTDAADDTASPVEVLHIAAADAEPAGATIGGARIGGLCDLGPLPDGAVLEVLGVYDGHASRRPWVVATSEATGWRLLGDCQAPPDRWEVRLLRR